MDIIYAAEFNPEIKKWLEWYSHQSNMTFSEAMNLHLEIGRQVTENEREPAELPKSQKLIIQCAMESLLILKEFILRDPEQSKAINERAKMIIRKTLAIQEASECPSS